MSATIYSKKGASKKFHYTYQITEISTNKKYIGVRSSDIEPEIDIGFKYFSSSTDKAFMDRQKENPSDYRYEVLSVHENRDDANQEEIRLHEEYDVSISMDFYNRACSTSTMFNTLGKAVVKDEDNNIFK